MRIAKVMFFVERVCLKVLLDVQWSLSAKFLAISNKGSATKPREDTTTHDHQGLLPAKEEASGLSEQ
jgi:hypothetical protein